MTEFIDWIAKEGYKTSRWPTTELELLKRDFYGATKIDITLQDIFLVMQAYGVAVEDGKAYVWKNTQVVTEIKQE